MLLLTTTIIANIYRMLIFALGIMLGTLLGIFLNPTTPVRYTCVPSVLHMRILRLEDVKQPVHSLSVRLYTLAPDPGALFSYLTVLFSLPLFSWEGGVLMGCL